jgi:hypothetical protein
MILSKIVFYLKSSLIYTPVEKNKFIKKKSIYNNIAISQFGKKTIIDLK